MMKRLVKGVAAKHSLIASFMPKPFEEEAGNGMHVHCSVLDESGANIFDDGTEKAHPCCTTRSAAASLTWLIQSRFFRPVIMATAASSPDAMRPLIPVGATKIAPSRCACLPEATLPAGSSTGWPGADANPYLLFCSDPVCHA